MPDTTACRSMHTKLQTHVYAPPALTQCTLSHLHSGKGGSCVDVPWLAKPDDGIAGQARRQSPSWHHVLLGEGVPSGIVLLLQNQQQQLQLWYQHWGRAIQQGCCWGDDSHVGDEGCGWLCGSPWATDLTRAALEGDALFLALWCHCSPADTLKTTGTWIRGVDLAACTVWLLSTSCGTYTPFTWNL